jgi:hypothetical protein
MPFMPFIPSPGHGYRKHRKNCPRTGRREGWLRPRNLAFQIPKRRELDDRTRTQEEHCVPAASIAGRSFLATDGPVSSPRLGRESARQPWGWRLGVGQLGWLLIREFSHAIPSYRNATQAFPTLPALTFLSRSLSSAPPPFLSAPSAPSAPSTLLTFFPLLASRKWRLTPPSAHIASSFLPRQSFCAPLLLPPPPPAVTCTFFLSRAANIAGAYFTGAAF